MKKLSLLLALVLVVSALAGCSPSQPGGNTNNVPANNAANSAENTVPPANTGNNANTVPADNTANTVPPANAGENTNTVPPENTANTVPPETPSNTGENTNAVPPAPAAPFGEPYVSGIFNEETLMQYLDGEWDMFPRGALPQYPDDEYLRLKVDAKEKTFLFTLAEDSSYVKLGLESIGRIFDFSESDDYIYMSVSEASEKYTKQASHFVGSSAEFQVVTANAWGSDYLAIREIGNGESGLAYYMLGFDKKSGDDFWVFRRVQNAPKIELSDAENDALLIKNGDFYAMTWLCFDDMFYLQQVDVSQEMDIFVEDPVPVLKSTYHFGNGKTLVAPSYKVVGVNVSDSPGQLRPMLVRVQTNDKGEILSMEAMKYIAYCEYEDPYVNDHWYRSYRTYGHTDALFLGEWKQEGGAATLSITAVIPEIGGYHVLMNINGKDKLESDAFVMGDELYIMSPKVGGKTVEGAFSPGENGSIVFEISESESDLIPAGSKYIFKR